MSRGLNNNYTTQEYDSQFQLWKKTVWSANKTTKKCNAKSTLIKKVSKELAQLRSLSANDYELLRKWYELRTFVDKYPPQRLEEVYNRIWIPKGYSDYRRIEPELIYIKDIIKSEKIDIWGVKTEAEWQINDPLAEDWDILRTLVSRHRNSGVIGKQHRYLVRDKGTKKYLGVICISVDMLEPAGRDALIGWTKEQKRKTQPHCANGSTIVPTSPFAGAFNGGKLLSLLCLSDEVAERWALDVGKDGIKYKLVHVMTTSLFGNTNKQTMYDNLDPFWIRTPAETSGNTPYELSPKLETDCRNWLYANEPRIYFDHFVAKKRDGSLKVRDPKDKAFKKLFSLFGIRPSEYMSGHKRGMYLAPLYDNAYQFLRQEISEKSLNKKFDNSVDAIAKEWKFGLTKNNSGAKARLEMLLSRQKKDQLKGKSPKPLPTYANRFWYRDMMEMTWEEVKDKYGDKPTL